MTVIAGGTLVKMRMNIGKSIKGDPQKLQFTIDGVVFKPFYETYGHHSVYVDVRLK